MGCCENRDGLLIKVQDKLPSSYEKLAESVSLLSQQQDKFRKMSYHLRHFHQKSNEFYMFVYELKAAKREYLRKYRELGNSVERMTELIAKLDTEVQAQYISERESTDLSKDELLSVIQIVRAQKQSSPLTSLSSSLRLYLSYPDRRQDFHIQVSLKVEIVRKKSSSLLDYVNYISEGKQTISSIIARHSDLNDITSISSEKLSKPVENWHELRKVSQKLADETESSAKRLLLAFQTIESDLMSVKQEVDSYLDHEQKKEKTREVLASAQVYLNLLSSETPQIARKSYRNSVERLSYGQATTVSQGGSIYMEEYLGVLRRLCLMNHYRDGEVASPEETYDRLIELMHAKADEDMERKGSYVPMELFLISQFAEGKQDKPSVVAEITRFTGALDKLSATPLGNLALEMLKFTENEPLSSHEEMFICKASSELQDMIDFSGNEMTIEEKWQTGGKMALSLVIPVIERWFSDDSETAEKVVPALLPNLPILDLTVFYVAFRLSQKEMTAEGLFYRLDTRRTNVLQKDEFVNGIRRILGIRIGKGHLMMVAEMLDKTASDGIFRNEFISLFSLERYESDSESEKFSVTRVGVIGALRKVFAEWKSEFTSDLYVQFLMIPSVESKVEIQNIRELVHTLDPAITDQQSLSFIRRLRSVCGQSFPFESFKDFFFQYPVGPKARSFFSIEGLAWEEEKMHISEFVTSLLKGKKSVNESAATTGTTSDK